MRETLIKYQTGSFWILDDVKNDRYTVFKEGATFSKADSSYPRTEDGLSIAKMRADYLTKRANSAPLSVRKIVI